MQSYNQNFKIKATRIIFAIVWQVFIRLLKRNFRRPRNRKATNNWERYNTYREKIHVCTKPSAAWGKEWIIKSTASKHLKMKFNKKGSVQQALIKFEEEWLFSFFFYIDLPSLVRPFHFNSRQRRFRRSIHIFIVIIMHQ